MSLTHLNARLWRFLWNFKDHQINPFYKFSVNELALNRKALDSLILLRLQEILQYAYQNSPFYHQTFDKIQIKPADLISLKDIKQFPILTRVHLRERLEDFSSINSLKKNWIRSATGGTTSSPIFYYRDHNTTLRRHADTEAIDEWFGRRMGDRVAYLWGAPQDFPQKPTIGMRLRNLTYLRVLMLPSAPLDDAIFESHFQQLVKWRPTFLQAYPSPLYEFCLYLKKSGRRLPFLKSASVTAEPLYDYQRKLIEEIFEFKIFNWYGSRELGRVASECNYHTGLHINEPSVFVEVEPDPSLPDGFGHLLVTDLWNRATPFIRYETGDIAQTTSGDCPCGCSLKQLARIEGRLVDMIVLPRGRKVPGVSLTNRIIKDFSEISELQVVQKTMDSFLLRFVRGPLWNSESLQKIESNLQQLIDYKAKIYFEELKELPRSPSGKIRFVISEVSEKTLQI